MLLKVKVLDFDSHYEFVPPRVDAVINTEAITSAKDYRPSRGGLNESFLKLRFRDGSEMVMVGKIDDLFETRSK